jgi:4-hydroxy 2-oxovalerate aldolase
MFKILDCTLRDGGYYTNWDFEKSLVTTYIDSMNKLPIDYLEVGYRSIPLKVI